MNHLWIPLVSPFQWGGLGGRVTIRYLREHDRHGCCRGNPHVDGDLDGRRERYRPGCSPTVQMPWEIPYEEAVREFGPWTRNGPAAHERR